MSFLALVGLLSAGLCGLVCYAMLREVLVSPYSVPSERSLHAQTKARGGGLGIAAAIMFGWVCLDGSGVLIAAIFGLWAVSAWDDWAGAPPQLRLAVHAIAAAVIVYFWIKVDSPIFALMTLIALIWATNLFNFMDGADGIA